MGDFEENSGIASSNNQINPRGVGLVTVKDCLRHGIKIYDAVMRRYCTSAIGEFISHTKLRRIQDHVKDSIVNEWEQRTSFRNLDKLYLAAALRDRRWTFKYRSIIYNKSLDNTIASSIGIHLRDNNCCISVFDKGQVHIVPNKDEGGILKTPNYITFSSDTFGEKLQQQNFPGPKSQNFRTEEIFRKQLAYIRRMVECYLRLSLGTVMTACIGVPSSFSGSQRQALRNAGTLVGFEEVHIFNDSFVSMLGYYYGIEDVLIYDGINLIYDFGRRSLVTTVLDGARSLNLKEFTDIGGEHIDKTMMDYCASRFKTAHGIDLFEGQNSTVKEEIEEAKRRLMRLQLACERAKIKLTTETTARICIYGIMQGLDLNVVVTRKLFDELNQSHFEKSIRRVEETLKEAGIGKDNIDGVILVGSSSRIPKVQELLEAYFGEKIFKSIDPEIVVAHGAALEATSMNLSNDGLENPRSHLVAPLPKKPDVTTAVVRQFEISNAKLFIANCDAEYKRLLETEESFPQTESELKNAHKRITDKLLRHMREKHAISDTTLQLDYERKLRAATKVPFDKLLEDLPLKQLQTLERERDYTLRRATTKIIEQFTSRMNSVTKEWLQGHLTQNNISEVKTIYDHLLAKVPGGVDGNLTPSPTKSSPWSDLEEIIKNECKKTYTAYLNLVHDKLQRFHDEVEKKFTVQTCWPTDELEISFQDEYEKVTRILPNGNSEIFQLVKAGCDKLMVYYREQNSKIIDNEGALAKKLMPDVLQFYDEEMKRYLNEYMYPQDQLRNIHLCLVEKLTEAFKTAFKFTSTNGLCENVSSNLDILRDELGHRFMTYLQQNQEKSSTIESEVVKLLETMKSSYASAVDTMIQENPEGLDPAEFEREHSRIVNKTKELLKTEIRKNTGGNGSFEANEALLQAHINDHWAFTSELNHLTWKRSKLLGGRGSQMLMEVVGSQMGPIHSGDENPKSSASTRASTIEIHENVVGVDPLISARQRLLYQSNEIKSQLDGGAVFTIKSSIVRNMFENKIQEAIDSAQSPESTEEQIEGHQAELVKWSSRYKK